MMFGSKMMTTIAAAVVVGVSITSADAAIMAVNQGKIGGSNPGATKKSSGNISVGVADMLIVMVVHEVGGGGPTKVTYGGIDLTDALAEDNMTTAGADTTGSIWYIDLSTPGITGNTLEVDMSSWGTVNGHASGWVSVDGNLGVGESIALHTTASISQAPPALDNTISITTTTETFNVVNFNGNAGGTVTVNKPTSSIGGVDNDGDDVIYSDVDIGSARSAAGWEEAVASGDEQLFLGTRQPR